MQNSDLKIKEKFSFFKMFKCSAVNSRSFRPRKIHEEIVKSAFICSKVGASSMDGKTASLLPKKQQKKRIVPVRLKWQEKDKALAAFRSSIAGKKNPKKVQGRSMKLISLRLISNQKYMPKLSTALHNIQ